MYTGILHNRYPFGILIKNLYTGILSDSKKKIFFIRFW